MRIHMAGASGVHRENRARREGIPFVPSLAWLAFCGLATLGILYGIDSLLASR